MINFNQARTDLRTTVTLRCQRSTPSRAVPGEESVEAAVHLNHVYVVLDPKDYQAIHDSSFLKDRFGVYEERETIRNDKRYKGLYFYGLDTYFELKNSADTAADPTHAPTACGVAFGVDQTLRFGDHTSLKFNGDDSAVWNF